ncbi:hypothetical protein GCM10008931_42470 [Oceanobacillus oncorhynchi subsp. oncorhynchi]|uniref:helix-turn-helix domain-containing protein n=1 Tax=Oceanobacillus oncorhynchi TaxID=545501 RepID=UPI0031D551B7
MTSYEIEDSTYLDEIEANATGHRIKFLARKAGLSQSELAKLLKRDEKTISNYYCGKSMPDKVDLIILSKILGTDCDNLLVYRGDLEGYQRIDYYSIEYNGKENEINHEAISRAAKESKLFDPHTKGRCNIRNLEEAGYCLAFFCYLTQLDIKKRMMDALLSSGGVHSIYMHHIFEFDLWRKLSSKQKDDCKAQFAIWRSKDS